MSSPESWKTWEGRVIAGKYLIPQWLGGSEHSAVFLTQRPGQPSQKAAIKLTAADGNADRQLSRWRAAAQLSHPNLIQIFESGRCQMEGTSLLYMVMEYAEEDLSQILPQRPLTPAEVADMVPPLLDALSYLHGKGFVHGRIKPSNVLAVADQLKLSSDTLIPLGEAASRQRPRDVYDAPETSAGSPSPAGDMWSLGITVAEALTQSVPSAGGTQSPALPGEIAEPFRGIVRECLHADPQRRCTIAQVQARLQPPARSVPAPVPPPAPVKHYRYSWRMLIPIAILLVFVLGIVFFRRAFSSKASGGSGEPTSEVAPAPFSPAASPKPSQGARTGQGEILHQALPDIPQSAMNTITGTIKISVRVEVDPSGKVAAARLVRAGPSSYFARLALEAAQRWQFSPPQTSGRPSAWLILFRLRRSGVQASAEKSR